jgi:hypothetical protein
VADHCATGLANWEHQPLHLTDPGDFATGLKKHPVMPESQGLTKEALGQDIEGKVIGLLLADHRRFGRTNADASA